jgi:hypothetical protein
MCQGKTKVRKIPLVISIEPNAVLVLNKTCKFCPKCEFVIGRQSEIESLMAETFAHQAPQIVGNPYVVIGILDKADWRAQQSGRISDQDVLERTWVFKDMPDIEISGGWEWGPPDA